MRLSPIHRWIWIFLSFVGLLLLVRFCWSGSTAYCFLVWNLFLAWIPLAISFLLNQNKNAGLFIRSLLFMIWLLFFPNALYILTDLIHLEPRQNIPLCYDVILLFLSSFSGLCMAFVSLLQVERFLAAQLRPRYTNVIVVGCLFAGSFGVYLGRFLRWNSWDIITSPGSLFKCIGHEINSPIEHYRTWGLTALLTMTFALLYFFIKKLPGLLMEPGNYPWNKNK